VCGWDWVDEGTGGGVPPETPGASGGGAANNPTTPKPNPCASFAKGVSRAVAGVTAPARFGVGLVKFLGGMVGAGGAPLARPVAPAVEVASDWAAWNGFGQMVSAGASAYYAVTGSAGAENLSNEATSLTTVSGLVVFGVGGSPGLGATLGSIENGVPTEQSTMAAAEAVIGLTELGGTLAKYCPGQ
jgi:hypothetical protein